MYGWMCYEQEVFSASKNEVKRKKLATMLQLCRTIASANPLADEIVHKNHKKIAMETYTN